MELCLKRQKIEPQLHPSKGTVLVSSETDEHISLDEVRSIENSPIGEKYNVNESQCAHSNVIDTSL